MTTHSWHKSKKGEVHSNVMTYVEKVEQEQSVIFERFARLEMFYDPNGPMARSMRGVDMSGVYENMIASAIDTVMATISTTAVRSRFMTDGGDWSDQRTARKLEWYIEGLAKLLGRSEVCKTAFKAAIKKGTGLVKVYVDQFDQIRVDHVLIDDVVVDEKQCRAGGKPRELHQRRFIDKDELASMFPKFEDKIESLSTGTYARVWAGYREIEENEVVVIESWRLPFGVPDKPGYRPGRHTIVADGIDLFDEEWEKPFFPFAKIVWTERDAGWYGISATERVVGSQRALNVRNRQIEHATDRAAYPTVFVRQQDAMAMAKTNNKIGNVVPYTGDAPVTITPPAVSPEVYKTRDELKQSIFEELGISRLAANSMKPAGIDSGVGLREYRDITTQRFAPQEQEFEKLNLEVDWLILDCAKDLGAEAPVIMRESKFGARRIKWADVDMQDVKVQIVAASTLPRTPSGRSQMVLEWAQAGVIDQDSARRLIGHPDLEKELSLYTAALESVEHAIDEIEDGNIVVPEPFDNLQMIRWRGEQRYLQIRDLGAPEEILEALRQYVVTASWMISQQSANMNAPQPQMPMPEEGMPGQGVPPGAPGVPPGPGAEMVA